VNYGTQSQTNKGANGGRRRSRGSSQAEPAQAAALQGASAGAATAGTTRTGGCWGSGRRARSAIARACLGHGAAVPWGAATAVTPQVFATS